MELGHNNADIQSKKDNVCQDGQVGTSAKAAAARRPTIRRRATYTGKPQDVLISGAQRMAEILWEDLISFLL